tara:strand:- start:9216 stop:9707 length:492 start_codon:yes stop_codon:yes gene_type:complete
MDIDFQIIRDAIKLAEDTSISAQSAAEALGEFRELSNKLQDIPAPDIKLATSEMLMQVASIQVANATLIQRLSMIEAALAASQSKKSDFDRYELWSTPAGSIMYRLKEGHDMGEPEHFICPNCIANKRKSYLQGNNTKICSGCETLFTVEPLKNPSAMHRVVN